MHIFQIWHVSNVLLLPITACVEVILQTSTLHGDWTTEHEGNTWKQHAWRQANVTRNMSRWACCVPTEPQGIQVCVLDSSQSYKNRHKSAGKTVGNTYSEKYKLICTFIWINRRPLCVGLFFTPADFTLCSDVTLCDVAVALSCRGEQMRQIPFFCPLLIHVIHPIAPFGRLDSPL